MVIVVTCYVVSTNIIDLCNLSHTYSRQSKTIIFTDKTRGRERPHPCNAVHSHYANGTNRTGLNKIDVRYLIPSYFTLVMYRNVFAEGRYLVDIFNGTNVEHKYGIIHHLGRRELRTKLVPLRKKFNTTIQSFLFRNTI